MGGMASIGAMGASMSMGAMGAVGASVGPTGGGAMMQPSTAASAPSPSSKVDISPAAQRLLAQEMNSTQSMNAYGSQPVLQSSSHLSPQESLDKDLVAIALLALLMDAEKKSSQVQDPGAAMVGAAIAAHAMQAYAAVQAI